MTTLVDIEWRDAFDELEGHRAVDTVQTVKGDGLPVYFKVWLDTDESARLNDIKRRHGLGIGMAEIDGGQLMVTLGVNR